MSTGAVSSLRPAAAAAGQKKLEGEELSSTFKHLCGNVTTAMLTLDNSLHEFLQFKDELLKYPLPSNMLLGILLMSSRLFRSYSDLCIPVGELTRLSQVHSSSWEMKAESLKKIRSDYENMQRRLNIALRKLELTAVETSRMKREKLLGHWEKLYSHVMTHKSHGRRWKFRIESLRRKLAAGHNPYLSDSDSDSDMNSEGEEKEELQFEIDDQLKDITTRQDVVSKNNNFLSVDEVMSRQTTPTPPPPPVETADASTCTSDPEYDSYLLVQLSRPSGILPKRDICCTISLGDNFYTSKVFPGNPEQGTSLFPQVFHFPLSEAETAALPPTCKPLVNSLTKLVIGVYPRNISKELAANVAIPLPELKLTDENTEIVPPTVRGEGEFQLDWDKINAEVSGLPIEYPLTLRGLGEGEGAGESDDENETPAISLICHMVKVQKLQLMESGTATLTWENMMSEMGYREIPETQSRAASALPYAPTPCPPSPVEQAGPTEEEVREEVEKETQQKLGALSLQHIEELKQLQQQYEDKLNSLSKTLSKVKAEKTRQIEDLESALIEMEKSKSSGKGRSMADIQRAIARRRKRVTHGLPEWGKDLPDDFFERLEMFREESIRKQEELIDRIRREVSEACEKQLATQHKLAPGTRPHFDSITEDVTLPALFMPTPLNKHLVYTPRAHQYFHPPGSTHNRVTQPPAIFKLPALHTGMQTINLFELSQQFSQPGQHRETAGGGDHHQSPHLTPAPPPSACSFYHTINMPSRVGMEGARLEEEEGVGLEEEEGAGLEEEEELDYGGGVSGRMGHRAQYAPRITK